MSDELPKNLTEFMNWKKASEEFELDPQLSTVGDLRKLIKIMQSEKRSEKGIEGLKDVGMGVLADLVPGGGTALSLAQTLKGMYTAPDDKKTNTMLDKLNVDDEVAMIVDDTVEENFLNQALKAIEGLSDDSPMPNINKELSDWLKSKYDARTVDGWEANESLVRDYVRNVLLERETTRLHGHARNLLTERSGMRVAEDLPDGIVVTVEEFGKRTVIYYDSTSEPGSTDTYPFGRITIEAPWPVGTCDGAWNVARADADQGWGPLLYDIAIEWATQNANGLMSDRASVDEEAISVWDKYTTLGRAKTYQVDGGENCDQDVAEEDKGSDWKESSLSKRYTRPPTTIDALKAAGRWRER